MRAADYERSVLRELGRILIEPGSQTENLNCGGEPHGGVRVEGVRLDGPEVVILFRDLDRPECLFEHRQPAVEDPAVLEEGASPHLYAEDAPRAYAEMVWALFEEEIYATGHGLPEGCSPGRITRV